MQFTPETQKYPNEGPICSRFRGESEQLSAKLEPETDASQILSREAYPREELLRLPSKSPAPLHSILADDMQVKVLLSYYEND